ncbi:unnamed protein product [Camellia sinensis]
MADASVLEAYTLQEAPPAKGSACWAMAKSWLDVQVDLELARLQPGGMDQFKTYEDAIDRSHGQGDGVSPSTVGPENWPLQVLNQQPRHLSALLQKLHSSDSVHEAITQECKEQHRQIEMNLMMGDIPHLLDVMWSWISPSEDGENVFRPYGEPQMIRFGAHLVLVLRYLLVEQMKGAFKEKIMTVGDLILHMYAIFLFSKHHEELVGIYASQLAHHRCIDLFVHMMELRLNKQALIMRTGRENVVLPTILDTQKDYKILKYEVMIRKAVSKKLLRGSVFQIIGEKCGGLLEVDRRTIALDNLFEARLKVRGFDSSFLLAFMEVKMEGRSSMGHGSFQYVKQERERARDMPHALKCVNILFREFALISMWRVPAMPIGAHTLLRFLAEPLKQPAETLLSTEDHDVSENLREFQDWYYSCDATYRNWLKVELENVEVSPLELSVEEKQRAIAATKGKENPWLVPNEDRVYESVEPLFLELHAIAMLCLPSGECMCPDATLCATLMSALYSSVSEEVVLNRQLMVSVSISLTDNCCIEVVLRGLAADGDGLGPHELNDGGILATVIAAGFKGELVRFQAGITMEISRLDAWYSSKDGSLEAPATYIVRGLCQSVDTPFLTVLKTWTSLFEHTVIFHVCVRLEFPEASARAPCLRISELDRLVSGFAPNTCILPLRGRVGLADHPYPPPAVARCHRLVIKNRDTNRVRTVARGPPRGHVTQRCCIPEVILRCMQISVSLVESGNPPESHDELIELVALPETGFLHLFSQQQLQVI